MSSTLTNVLFLAAAALLYKRTLVVFSPCLFVAYAARTAALLSSN